MSSTFRIAKKVSATTLSRQVTGLSQLSLESPCGVCAATVGMVDMFPARYRSPVVQGQA